MSRHCADVFRIDLVAAVRRLAVAALVVSTAGLAVAESAEAASAPLRRKPHSAAATKAAATKATARAKAAAQAKAQAKAQREAQGKAQARPKPGPYGYQAARGSRANGRQHRSGTGKNIQNLNGVSTPSLLSGPQSTTVTSAGKITSQGAYCAPGSRSCDISQNMR
ncbi:hypothetical protein AB0C14_17825 [Microbispora hainanensis]|uniref:hypothetical protein n=1 Tax=Microbispora hainanensis TaxID=568844 RepID=UPI0033F70F19